MNECVFCKIINKEFAAKIIYEDELTLAFLDIDPISDGHTLVIPKKHFINFADTDDVYLAAVAKTSKKVATILNDSFLKPWGFNYLSNQGVMAKQVVMHFHMHIVPKYAAHQGLLVTSKRNLKTPIDEIHKLLIK